MVFSVTMFAYFIGNISSILTRWGSVDDDYTGHIRNLKLFMEKEDLPKEMRKRILTYYDYCYKYYRTFPFSDPSVTDDLSPALKSEISACLNDDLTKYVPHLEGKICCTFYSQTRCEMGFRTFRRHRAYSSASPKTSDIWTAGCYYA
jgi:hypothetical protein